MAVTCNKMCSGPLTWKVCYTRISLVDFSQSIADVLKLAIFPGC